MLYDVVDRHAWNASAGRGSLLEGPRELVVIHHTQAPSVACHMGLAREVQAVRSIETFHAVDRGWHGIGYNWLVMQSGRVFEGRGWNRVGAHAGNAPDNRRSYGIVFVIDGRIEPPTRAAIEATRALLEDAVARGYLAEDYEVVAHGDLKSTECPGAKVRAVLDSFRPT